MILTLDLLFGEDQRWAKLIDKQRSGVASTVTDKRAVNVTARKYGRVQRQESLGSRTAQIEFGCDYIQLVGRDSKGKQLARSFQLDGQGIGNLDRRGQR